MDAMYQVFSRLDNYNMMIKLKKIAHRYVNSSVMVNVLGNVVVIGVVIGVVINELW
jgi:hypothetical protein